MSNSAQETLKFRYVWPVRVSLKKLNPSEVSILQISPKFATCYDHVSFQWSLKLRGTQNLNHDDEEDLIDKEYVAVSIYYVDGPASSVEIFAKVNFGSTQLDDDSPEECIQAIRGEEAELVSCVDQKKLSEYVTTNLGKKIRISVTFKMSAKLFKPEAYLNAASPTPFCSFLTANYRARACSKVWKRRSRQSFKRPRSHSEGQPNCQKLDLERKFNRVMEMESLNRDETTIEITGKKPDHLFKKLLVNCCETCCERRASIIPCDDEDYEELEIQEIPESTTPTDEKDENAEDENAFECQEDKEEIHDTLANMYFNKIALPEMEYIEDFADFLIDAELSELPVLKRACERYLCGELNTKSDIQTSLLLELLYLSMFFNLPIMKSMTLTELCERHDELIDIEKLLEQEECKKLDNKIRQASARNLSDLVNECLRFREQRLRVDQIL